LPSALVDAAFKQALAQVDLTAATVQNVPVDVQQASETLKPKLASIAAQLTAPGAIIASAGMAEVRDALFQCLKTLTFKNDIQWQAELLEQVGKTIDDAADLPLVQEIVQSAVSTLKAHLADGSISGQAKLYLYSALIDFIQDVADQSAGKDNKSAMHIWAIKALEAMANDEVLAEVMEGIDPGARLWPTWAATELKLGHEIQGIDQCIFFLNDCKPSSPEGSNYRFDRMCTKAIELYTITINIQDLDGRQTDALKLYAIWLPLCKPMESIDLTTQPSVATILALIKSLSTSLMRNEDLGVTTQGDAMLVVLLVQLLQHNPILAREQLEKVSQYGVLLNRYPLLGIAAHLLFARYYRSIEDRANEVAMVTAAQLLLPPLSENDAFRAASEMILAFINDN